MRVHTSVHPNGLDPFQAAKAWMLRTKLKLAWKEVRGQVLTARGGRPGQRALELAVKRIDVQQHQTHFRRTGTATLAYSNCGRKPMLTPEQKSAVVAFVKRWRSKRFCTAAYIVRELRLLCSKRTVHRVLNEAGYHWRPVPRRSKLTDEQLKARRAFVDAHIDKPAAW